MDGGKIPISLYNKSMTQRLNPVIQQVRDLRLVLVTQDSLPQTTILREAHIQQGDWQVCFAIIGESHRIRIERGANFVLEEMLACIDVAPDHCLHDHNFSDLAAHQYQQHGYRITTHFSQELPPRHDSTQHIEYQFPQINGLQPLTRIEWQLKSDRVRWWTVHSYVEAEKISAVYTESEFHFEA